ncbi:hypothetical protein [Streptomyces sp. NPDC048845]|uniref:hypothetical protein n=1 Tax=Streptomyces sp. NPDC048845 TaxID=3155390 RepID=UPI003429EBFC
MGRNFRTGAAALTAGGVLLLAAGCGGTDDGTGRKDRGAPRTATGTVEQLAEKATCEPDIQIDAAELRQGLCGEGDGRYVLTTFATHRGQQDWLSEAQAYGGSYLVGPKWVAVGEPEVLAGVRDSLGGEVETAPSHGGSEHPGEKEHPGGAEPSGKPGHSGDGDSGGHGDGHSGDGGSGRHGDGHSGAH